MKTLNRITGLALVAATLGFGAQTVSAQALYTLTGGSVRDSATATAKTGFTFIGGNFTGNVGFDFTPTANESVTSLGYFNYNGTATAGAGLSNAHTVGLYDPAGVLLTSTSIAAGAVGTADTNGNFFAYSSVAPITLTAGVQYTLFGTTGNQVGDGFVQQSTGVIYNGITYNKNQYNLSATLSGSRLAGSGTDFQQPGYFGPNAIIAAAAAPEPAQTAALGLFGLGLGALVLKARKRKADSMAV